MSAGIDMADRLVRRRIRDEGIYPDYYGKVAAAYGDGNPARVLDLISRDTVVDATPTNISTTVARISYFCLPFDLKVNRLRYYSVGATSSVYRAALYRYRDLLRLMAETAFTTTANAWRSVGSALAIQLVAGEIYFVAVSVNATGATAGVRCLSGTPGGAEPWRSVLPSAQPGNLRLDDGFAGLPALGEFAVTGGALPDPAATLAVQGAWTGGMPAFFLDNNDA